MQPAPEECRTAILELERPMYLGDWVLSVLGPHQFTVPALRPLRIPRFVCNVAELHHRRLDIDKYVILQRAPLLMQSLCF